LSHALFCLLKVICEANSVAEHRHSRFSPGAND
jgi:hypothetical protein